MTEKIYMPTDTKTAFITIVGRANVGKSSLLNAVVGEKVAITSNKPQTTRTKITGIVTKNETQFVFIDTPGMHKAKNKLGEHMVKSVHESAVDVDAALVVVEAQRNLQDTEVELINSLNSRKIPIVLVINKIDLCKDKSVLMGQIEKCTKDFEFCHVVPLSAKSGDGVDVLMEVLQEYAQPSVHFFPDDILTDQPERVIVAEIIREKLLRITYEEIPHGIAVTIERMKERKNQKGLFDIDATIFCERQNHKGMIIGKGGVMLKKVGSSARADIESFLDVKVNLRLWVKVKEDWRNKEGLIRDFGLS